MTRLQLHDSISVRGTAAAIDTNALFELGMIEASGRDAPVDLVSAHMWFNIAATRGHVEAARLRREVAAEMTDAEIGRAQRAARDWLKAHSASETRANALSADSFAAPAQMEREAA